MNIIPVITLYQPWASWVIKGWKTIETRTHDRFKSLEGKTIGIHAGSHFDDHDDEVMSNPYLSKLDIEDSLEAPTGVFLGTVMVDSFSKLNSSHSQRALIDCGMVERHGLFLSSPKMYFPFEPVKGSMGIWYFDLDTMKKVKKPNALKKNLTLGL